MTVPIRSISQVPAGDDAAVLQALLRKVSVQEFLEHEAELLDGGRFDEWLEMLADDITYRAPVRVVRRAGSPGLVTDMFHFDDNRHSLGLRVRRLGTGVAWSEDPPSRTRRFVTNVRVGDQREDELAVSSYLLLYRSRGDDGSHDLISAERHDVLRAVEDRWRLCRRDVMMDQSTLGTKNLAVFL